MARKRQRKKRSLKQKGVNLSVNLVVPFTRAHSTKVKPNKTRKGQRKESKVIDYEL